MTIGNSDRRRFLRTAAAGALVGPAIGALPAAAQQTGPPQVLILGAGMAGIAASYWLRQHGISSLVLEGRNRLGGRLWTSRHWPDAPLDMGGAFIHDSPHSPLTPLQKKFNIKTVETDFANFTINRANGVKLTTAQGVELVGLYGVLFAQLKTNTAVFKALGLPDRPLSLEVDKILAGMKLSAAQRTDLNLVTAATSGRSYPTCRFTISTRTRTSSAITTWPSRRATSSWSRSWRTASRSSSGRWSNRSNTTSKG
jgi:monoamine oxidase